MPRLKADPVDIAFRAWAALDTEGKQRLADRMAGYQEAMGVVNGDKPAPRTRQRKAKANHLDSTSTKPIPAEVLAEFVKGSAIER